MTTPQHHDQPLPPYGAPYGPGAPIPGQRPHIGYVQGGVIPQFPYAQPGCRVCGAAPAGRMAIRAHQGVLVFMRFYKLDGPFCHTCGRAMVRDMTTRTLVQGWWSPFSLVAFTPFTLVWNWIAYRKFTRLPPSAAAPGRRALSEGTALHRRPLAYVSVIPLVWAIWFIHGMITHAG